MPATVLRDVVCHLRKAALSVNGASLTDGQLLERFLSLGEEAAFEALVRRHGPMVWSVCRRFLPTHDAEDAFQPTFLVFVRKAASVMPQAASVMPREMLGNWLYGVAYRTALGARKTISWRQTREKQLVCAAELAGVRGDSNSGEIGYAEISLLHREVQGLPAKYRTPIVLCDLEGQSRKEAARHLGWSEGTLSGRLARARSLLAKRLTRRGLTLSATGLVLVLSQSFASGEVPPLLLAATVKAGMSVAGQTLVAGGLISAPVAALTQGVLRTMLMTKLKSAGSIILGFVIVVAGAGMVTFHAMADHRPMPTASAPNPHPHPPRVGGGQGGGLAGKCPTGR